VPTYQLLRQLDIQLRIALDFDFRVLVAVDVDRHLLPQANLPDPRVEGFRRLLGLPKNVTPHSLVPLGYPAEQPPQEERYRADRVHHNGW
jgi:hypothetical protein